MTSCHPSRAAGRGSGHPAGSGPAGAPVAHGRGSGRRPSSPSCSAPLSGCRRGAYIARTTIAISFKTGEGIEPRKTKIKYKNVDIGEVRTVTLSEDRSRVIVTAQITREAEPLLVADTRFWGSCARASPPAA